jgi:uncharacterized protein YbjT (DUF2867 family)
MKVIITGASGMVGKGVLLECLDDPKIEIVLSIGRSPANVDHEKIIEVQHPDFSSFDSIAQEFNGFDACYFCLGVSAGGMMEKEYTKITYDFTLTLAYELYKLNPEMTFTYVSGQGTDSSEKGKSMWARVKGKVENDLMAVGFKQSFMFRPGAIIPLRGIKSKTKSYQFFYNYFMWLIKFIKLLAPKSVVNTTEIGLAMINVTRDGYAKQIIDPEDIHILAGS